MSPVTSFTASLGYNGLIDIFALALGPQPEPGHGVVVWHARQETPGGEWSGWANEGKPGAGALDVCSILDAQKHGHVLAKDAGGRLWFKERGPADAFSSWEPLGGPSFAPSSIDPTVGHVPHDAGGFTFMCGAAHVNARIDVAGTANNRDSQDIFYRSRPGGDAAWTAWSHLGDNGFVGGIAAAVAGNDALDVVTPVGIIPAQAGALQEIDISHRRRRPDGAWTAWALLGRPPGGFNDDITPVLILRSGGGPELFAVSVANAVWHNSQTGTGWSGWAPLGNAGGPVTGITVADDAGNGLNLCVTHKNHSVTHRRQDIPGGPWGSWTNLSAPDASTIANPALILDSQGCLNLLLSRPHKDGIITLRQQVPSGPFVKGPALPALPH